MMTGHKRQRRERADRPLHVQVEAWGPLACFTRPELKVERVSYPTMTLGGTRAAGGDPVEAGNRLPHRADRTAQAGAVDDLPA